MYLFKKYGGNNCFGSRGVEWLCARRARITTTLFLLILLSPICLRGHDAGFQEMFLDSEIETVRERVIADLRQGSIDDAEINRLMATIKTDGSWPGINYEDVSRTGFDHSRHLSNMLLLCRTYRTEEAAFYLDATLQEVIGDAFDFWTTHDFICDNWWWNEIGTPNYFIDMLLLMDDHLTDEQQQKGMRIAKRANLEGFGARPGGDLIKLAAMVLKQGLYERNERVVREMCEVMTREIKITTGRGLKPDLSFHHRKDNVISTLSYGIGYINAFAYWAVTLAGTKYSLSTQAVELLIDYFLDGICKSMVYGKYPDPGAKNRGITRRGALNAANPGLAQNLRRSSTYRSDELDEIIDVRLGKTTPSLSSSRFFRYSEYYTHQRPHFFASVRMHSDRNHNMEQPYNGEGLKNHHYADGSNFISRTGREYERIFPVFDWQKIPGTTVVQKPALPGEGEIAKKGVNDFVGAVTDGTYGAAAFDFSSVHDPLHARKSWFFFDDEFVCLGAGIHSDAEYPVATTLNQCLWKGDVWAATNHEVIQLARGQHSLDHVSWVLHDSVGYFFPEATSLYAANEIAEGSWRQINHQSWSTDEVIQKDVFTLWFDHGIKPQDGGYAYVVIPGTDKEGIAHYSQSNTVQVLANTANIQAVKHTALGVSQLVFYRAGEVEIGGGIQVRVSDACMVMLTVEGNTVKQLKVSDPSRKLRSLQITIGARVEGAETEWDKDKKVTRMKIVLPRGHDVGT